MKVQWGVVCMGLFFTFSLQAASSSTLSRQIGVVASGSPSNTLRPSPASDEPPPQTQGQLSPGQASDSSPVTLINGDAMNTLRSYLLVVPEDRRAEYQILLDTLTLYLNHSDIRANELLGVQSPEALAQLGPAGSAYWDVIQFLRSLPPPGSEQTYKQTLSAPHATAFTSEVAQ